MKLATMFRGDRDQSPAAAPAPTVDPLSLDLANLPSVRILRERMAEITEAREAHALLVQGKATAQSEVDALASQRAKAAGCLATREREIALAGLPMPAEALPEELEVNRLDRHIRICRVRVQDWDQRVTKSEQGLQALAGDLWAAWQAVGAEIFERALQRYVDAVLAMRAERFNINPIIGCFRGEPFIRIPFFNHLTAVHHPRDGSLLLDPQRLLEPRYWPPEAAGLGDALRCLQDEVGSAMGRSRSGTPQGPETEEPE